MLLSVAVGLARSEARAEGLRKAGIEPVIGELSQTDILAKAAASGTALLQCHLGDINIMLSPTQLCVYT